MPSKRFAIAALCLALTACRSMPQQTPSPTAERARRGPDPTFLSAVDRNRLETAAADPYALTLSESLRKRLDPRESFLLGVEHAAVAGIPELAGRRCLLLTAPGALDQQGRLSLESMLALPGADVLRVALVSIDERAPARTPEMNVLLAKHPQLAVFELNGTRYRPSPAMLEGIDAVLVDLPFRGTRYGTELPVLAAMMQETAARRIRIIVLDRPPVLDARAPDGMLSEATFSGQPEFLYPLPPVPALTIGELARLLNNSFSIDARLEVMPMAKWRRADGNDWLNRPTQPDAPAPQQELKRRAAAAPEHRRDYAALSVVRELGDRAGIPWQAPEITIRDGAAELSFTVPPREGGSVRSAIPTPLLVGLETRSTTETLSDAARERITLRATGAVPVRPVSTSIALLRAIAVEPKSFTFDRTIGLYGAPWVAQAMQQEVGADRFIAFWLQSEPYREFLESRQKVLLYP